MSNWFQKFTQKLSPLEISRPTEPRLRSHQPASAGASHPTTKWWPEPHSAPRPRSLSSESYHLYTQQESIVEDGGTCQTCISMSHGSKLQFSPDTQVTECLSEMWDLYETALQVKTRRSHSQLSLVLEASVNIALHDQDDDPVPFLMNYITTFNGVYKGLGDLYTSSENVNLLYPAQTAHAIDISRSTEMEGHPIRATIQTASYAKELLHEVSDMLAAEKLSKLPQILTMIQHFEVLARFSGNHHVLWEHDVFADITTWIIHDLLDIYFPYLHGISADTDTSDVSHRVRIEDCLICYLELTQHLLDPNFLWKGWLLTWSEKVSWNAVSVLNNMNRTRVASSAVSICLHIIDGLTLHKMSPKSYTLVMQSLNVCGSVMINYQKEFSSISNPEEALEKILRCTQIKTLDVDHDSSSLTRRTDFRLSLLALHVAFCMKYVVTSLSLQCLDTSLGKDISEFAKWICEFSGGFESDEESYVGLNAFPLVPSIQADIAAETRFDSLSTRYVTAGMGHRMTSQEAYLLSPLASQELDLLFRLMVSYCIFDARTRESSNPTDSVLAWILNSLSGCLSSCSDSEILSPMEREVSLPKCNFFLIGSLFYIVALESEQPNCQQRLIEALAKSGIWDLLFGPHFIGYQSQVQALKLKLDGLSHPDFVISRYDDRKSTMKYLQLLGKALSQRIWSTLQKTLLSDCSSAAGLQICRHFIGTLNDSESGSSVSADILRTLHVTCELNGVFMRRVLFEFPILDTLAQLFTLPDGLQTANVKPTLDILDNLIQPDVPADRILKSQAYADFVLEHIYSANDVLRPFALRHLSMILSLAATHYNNCSDSGREKSLGTDIFSKLSNCFENLNDSHRFKCTLSILLVVTKLMQKFGANDTLNYSLKGADFPLRILDLLRCNDTFGTPKLSIALDAMNALRLIYSNHTDNSSTAPVYDSLIECLRDNTELVTDSQFVEALIGFAIDRTIPLSSMRHEVLRNPLGFKVILQLYASLDSLHRLQTVTALNDLLENPFNAASIHSQSADYFRDIVANMLKNAKDDAEFDALENFMVTLLCADASIANLKSLMSCLKVPNADSELPRYYFSILRAMSRASKAPKHPLVFFTFTGLRSCLQLSPSASPMFPEGGFAIGVWFRFHSLYAEFIAHRVSSINESPGKVTGSSYQPHLLSFADDKGSGLDMLCQNGEILISVKPESQKQATNMYSGFLCETNRWYQVVLSYKPPKKMSLSKGSLTLYVDGSEISTWKVDPPPTNVYTHCSIFGRGQQSDDASHKPLATDVYGCAGDVGSAWMMRRPLSLTQARQLYEAVSQTVVSDVLPDITDSLDFEFQPRACDLYSGSVCLSTVNSSQAILKNARIHSGVDIKYSLQKMGGLKSWLHLVDKMQVLHNSCPEAADEVIRAICTLSLTESENFDEFLFIFILLLRRSRSSFLLPSTIEILSSFAENHSSSSQISLMISRMLLDFRIWRTTTCDTQLAHSDLCKRILKSKNKNFHGLCTLQLLTDAMLMYFESPQENESPQELDQIRKEIFELMYQIGKCNPTVAFFEAVCMIANATRQSSHSCLALQMIDSVLKKHSYSHEAVENLYKSFGPNLDVLIALLTSTELHFACVKYVVVTLSKLPSFNMRAQTEPLFIYSVLSNADIAHLVEGRSEYFRLLNAAISCTGILSPVLFMVTIHQLLKVGDDFKVESILDEILTAIRLHNDTSCFALRRVFEWFQPVLRLLVKSVVEPVHSGVPRLLMEISSNILAYLIRTDIRGATITIEVCFCLWAIGNMRGMFLAREVLKITIEICSQNDLVVSETGKSNLALLIDFAGDLLFNHSDLRNIAKACSAQVPNHDSVDTSVDSSSFYSTDSGNTWEMGNMAELIVDVAETKKLFVQSSAIFPTVLRFLTGALMSERKEICASAALKLKMLMQNYSFGPNNSNAENVPLYLKKDAGQKMKYVLGCIHQSMLTWNGDAPDELYATYLFCLERWKIHMAAYQPDLASRRYTSKDDLLTYVNGNSWSFVYDNQLRATMKEIEESFSASSDALGKKYQNIVMVGFLKMVKSKEAEIEQRLSVTRNAILLKSREQEKIKTRLAMLSEKDSVNDELAIKQWIRLSRELRSPTGLWPAMQAADLHWKLDAWESHSRMRKKLVPNLVFDDHMKASIKRDKIDTPNLSVAKAANILVVKPTMLDVLTESPGGKSLYKQISDMSLLSVDDEHDLTTRTSDSVVDDDDWDLVNGDEMLVNSKLAQSSERHIISVNCSLVVLMSVVEGRLEITSENLSFTIDEVYAADQLNTFDRSALVFDSEAFQSHNWTLSSLVELHGRRHLLQPNSLEMFFADRTNVFFAFLTCKERDKVYQKISRLNPPNLILQFLKPLDYFKQNDATQRWANRQMSNFDYLMHLNSISGRSYNDLTQYPVFPWVISDYTSDTIDLTDSSVYRDLSKPVGALNEARLERYIERYKGFADSGIPKFHYGTHYCSAASVLFYLIRQEPFTSLHIALQNGRFDHADRQFYDIASTWRSCLENSGDVKELIPEFFYCPEFLSNSNAFDLGVKQTGLKLSHVILPPWADTADEFIRINRQALESDYVSENLHQWIDLIFGYKQRGEEAAKAHNTFYYLTYEGAVDLESITDLVEKNSIESQINNFGQIPSQLFDRPHPRRPASTPKALRRSLLLTPTEHQSFVMNVNQDGICGLQCLKDDDTCVKIGMASSSGVEVSTISFETSPEGQAVPCNYSKINAIKVSQMSDRRTCFSFIADGKRVITGGHWDGSLKIISTETGDVFHSFVASRRTVSSVGLSEDEQIIACGDTDAIVTLWKSDKIGSVVSWKSLKTFTPHSAEISAVALNLDYDLLVTAALDDSVVVHSVCKGSTLFKLDYLNQNLVAKMPSPVHVSVCISSEGFILVHSMTTKISTLHVSTINGKILASREMLKRVRCCTFDTSGSYVLTGDGNGTILILNTHNLANVQQFNVSIAVTGLYMTKNEKRMIVAREDGSVMLLAIIPLMSENKSPAKPFKLSRSRPGSAGSLFN